MPPGSAENSKEQYCVVNEDTGNLQWIDVSFGGQGSSEPSWLDNRECALIHRYDIVKPEWEQPCKDWCMENFGADFYFNVECSSRMPVLVTCQKAYIAAVFDDDTSVAPWMLGIGVSCSWLFIGVAVGSLRFYLGEANKATVSFTTRNHIDGSIELLGGVRCCTGMTRCDEMRFKVVRMFVSNLLDVCTDIYSLVLFVAKGQPYFAIAQLVAIVSGSGEDDLFGSFSVMWLCWSWKNGVPARVLFEKRVYIASEAFYSMVILAVFLLKVPHMDENGDPLLSWYSIGNYLVSVISACNAFRETNETRVYKAAAEKVGCWFDDSCNSKHFDKLLEEIWRNRDIKFAAKCNGAYGVVAGIANAGLLAICFNALPAWQVALCFFLNGSVLVTFRYLLAHLPFFGEPFFGERYGGPVIALVRSCSYAVLASLSGAWRTLEWWPTAGLSPQVLAMSSLKSLLVAMTVLSLALQVPLFALSVYVLRRLEGKSDTSHQLLPNDDEEQERGEQPAAVRSYSSRKTLTKQIKEVI